jgi:hypothetical protein
VNFKDQFHAPRIPGSEAAWYLWVLRLGLGGGVATSEREVSAPNGGTPRVGRKTSSDAEGTGVISQIAVSGELATVIGVVPDVTGVSREECCRLEIPGAMPTCGE